ncbi:hypothetical protein B0H11DRAFT_2307984 [Mycena galericulata]|nr:hypothetical protein B0H11DRAFT_2307984 [Mycena galericulata]
MYIPREWSIGPYCFLRAQFLLKIKFRIANLPHPKLEAQSFATSQMNTETNPGPFQILELVDHTFGFLDTAEDFRACALVSRVWAYPAQSRIFAEIDVGNDARLATLLAILEASPHLVGFISCLSIRDVGSTRLSHLEALSLLPYKRLVTLSVLGDRASSHFMAYLPIQRLLRIPSLTSVTILCTFAEEEMFFRIWEGCSGNIRHLTHGGSVAGGRSQASACHKRIKLHSLVDSDRSPAIESWLNDPRCPFDVSALKAFKFHRADQLHGVLSTARDTVEVAAITADVVVDLSLFRRLVQLEISSIGPGFVFEFRSISTLAPETRTHLEAIRFLLLLLFRDADDLAGLLRNLDRQISGIQDDFPNLKIVEVVVYFPTPMLTKSVDEYFPSLDARISLRWNFRPETTAMWYVRM